MVLTIPLSDVVFCSCTRAWYTDGGRCLFLWIQIRGGIVVRAADCRSAGPWFNSGWRSWFIFMTGSDNLMNHPAQRYNTMSPIRTVITTITRKSVNSGGGRVREKTTEKRGQTRKKRKNRKTKKKRTKQLNKLTKDSKNTKKYS